MIGQAVNSKHLFGQIVLPALYIPKMYNVFLYKHNACELSRYFSFGASRFWVFLGAKGRGGDLYVSPTLPYIATCDVLELGP